MASMSEQSTAALKAMLEKGSGASATEVRAAIEELKSRGEPTPPPQLVVGARKLNKGGMTTKKPQMMYGGMANGKKHNYAGGGNVSDKMNKGLRALQKEAPEVVAKMLSK